MRAARTRQGQRTAEFGKWLIGYLADAELPSDYRVYYDHGDAKVEANVVAPKGFVGEQVDNLNRLADVDVMVVSSDKTVRLLIEIEERPSRPKAILGNVLANLMCNSFAIRTADAKQDYFRVDHRTKLIVAGVLPAGKRLLRIQSVVLPRLHLFPGLPDCVRPTNVEMAFSPSLESTIAELKSRTSDLLDAVQT